MKRFKGQRVLVTGACGTVGSAIVRTLLGDTKFAPAEVVGIDNNESGLFELDQLYVSDDRAHFFVADIRNSAEISRLMHGIDIVLHAAALKHVVMCERSPDQAIQTNILGVQNIIAAARAAGVSRVIFTSSDKAVNPTNVMGTSKLMGERLFTAANSQSRSRKTIFASTRFGNVLGSNGSVVPIFKRQIMDGGPVTLTHREMTRFVMSLDEAVRLVLDSATKARGGEVFVTKMPTVAVKDLAVAMIRELAPQFGRDPEGIAIIEVGTKPGEKLYEELMSHEEQRRSVELERYYAVLPAFRGMYHDINYDYDDLISDTVTLTYNSSQTKRKSVDDIREMLKSWGVLDTPSEVIAKRYWPGDKEGHAE